MINDYYYCKKEEIRFLTLLEAEFQHKKIFGFIFLFLENENGREKIFFLHKVNAMFLAQFSKFVNICIGVDPG